jgi:hypothetical protein
VTIPKAIVIAALATVLCILISFPIAYVLGGPTRRIEMLDYVSPHRISRGDLAAGVVGLGLAMYVEVCGIGPSSSLPTGGWEHSQVTIVRDVIRVPVSPQDVSGLDSPALRSLVERLHRRAGVDEDGRPAFLVRKEIGVREPARIHAPLDEHRSLGYWHTEEEEIRGRAV